MKKEKQTEELAPTRTENAKIEDIGLDVSCRRSPVVRVIFITSNGCGCSTEFDPERAWEFLRIFADDHDINIDDGVFIERLKNKYVRLVFDSDEPFQGRLVEIGHIIDDEWFPLKKED